jgi:hypothetical protein
MDNREELTKKVFNLIDDMERSWRVHFDEPPSVKYMEATASHIVSEVIQHQLETELLTLQKEGAHEQGTN